MAGHINQRRALAVEKREKAVRLRIAGYTYEQIGKALGNVTKVRAFQIVKQALDDTRARTAQATEELRDIEVARLDQLTRMLWPTADPDASPEVQAVQIRERALASTYKLVRISERRCRLLGLDLQKDTGMGDSRGKSLEELIAESMIEAATEEATESHAVPVPTNGASGSNGSNGEGAGVH